MNTIWAIFRFVALLAALLFPQLASAGQLAPKAETRIKAIDIVVKTSLKATSLCEAETRSAEAKFALEIASRSPIGARGGVGQFPGNKFFKERVQWQAPSKGTGQNYTVYRQDIDWNLRIGNETNLQLAARGNAPYVMKNGRPQRLNLHHSKQDARGSLFELSEQTHLRTRKGHGREALHPYGRMQHPDYPVDRGLFGKDKSQYWIDRAAEAAK